MSGERRPDGRTQSETRQLGIKHGILSRADGSAQIQVGGNDVCVVCSVTGPAEVKQRDELLDRATLEINILPLKGLPAPWCRTVAHALKTVLAALLQLHKHPRSLVQITVQTLAAPSLKYSKPFKTFNAFAGGEEQAGFSSEVDIFDDRPSPTECATFLNTAILACINAGLPMSGTAAAVSLAYHKGNLIMDPTALELRDADCSMICAYSYGKDIGSEPGSLIWFEIFKANVGLDDDQVSL